MKVHPLVPGLCALALCFGCDEDDPVSTNSAPSLRVGGGGECGVTLPIPTAADFGARTFRTAAITVSGIDPGASNMEIRGGTEVTILQTANGDGPPQVVAFQSSFESAIAAGLGAAEALQQAAQSKSVTFVGGVAQDRVFCLTGGTVFIEATIPSYAGGGGFVGAVTTPQTSRVQIRCVSAEVYQQQCGDPVPLEMGVPDAGMDMGEEPDAGGDIGPVGDAVPVPALWNIQFIPPEDPEQLKIGIRNSGLGRRDNTELTFAVAELDVPLSDVLVKFFLDEITQPGVTISGGNASLFEDDDEVVVVTAADGLARVRLVAGGTPGLAAVRAVALRYNKDDLRGCVEGEADYYECLFEAYCGNNLSRVEQAPECEENRSQAVTIEAGIPSGRSLHFGCVHPVVPAFSNRERVRGRDHWGLALVDGTDCVAQLADRVNGRIKQGTGVFFLSEAGSVDEVNVTNEQGQTKTLLRIGQDPPKDVPSDDYELEQGFPEEGHNPRDGLVRVVMFTRGEEAFEDVDGDSVFNEAAGDFQEPGQDLPEPFVDADDDGAYDFGERFRDSNNNEAWDDANGQWDATTDIWESTSVLWTGELFSCLAPQLAAVGSVDCDDPDLIPEAVQHAPIEVSCGDGCSLRDPINETCVAGSVFLAPGEAGRFMITANFLDINGNCVNGRGTASYEIRPGNDLAVGGGNPLRGSVRCSAGFEKPLGQRLSFEVIDIFVPGDEVLPTVTNLEVAFSYEGPLGDRREFLYVLPVCR